MAVVPRSKSASIDRTRNYISHPPDIEVRKVVTVADWDGSVLRSVPAHNVDEALPDHQRDTSIPVASRRPLLFQRQSFLVLFVELVDQRQEMIELMGDGGPNVLVSTFGVVLIGVV